jgi:hypothetical protein
LGEKFAVELMWARTAIKPCAAAVAAPAGQGSDSRVAHHRCRNGVELPMSKKLLGAPIRF